MKIEKDSAGNRYTEILLPNGEKIRVTHIEDSWGESGGICLQVCGKDDHLCQGPEIPLDSIGDVIAAVMSILRDRKTN